MNQAGHSNIDHTQVEYGGLGGRVGSSEKLMEISNLVRLYQAEEFI